MGDLSKEPSMEDILSSIRRVIEREDAERPATAAPTKDAAPVEDYDEPLELTEISPAPADDEADDFDAIVSEVAAEETRKRLARLATRAPTESAPVSGPTASPTIEDMVRESLRPMLKAWLDDNLPDMVERIVTREVERITRGKG